MSSDHFAPWSERQGESGFAWSFLGAALARTSLPFGDRQRAGTALPPGDHRPGRGDAVRDVPGAAVDRARAPARRRTSTSPAAAGRARRSATRGCASARTSCGRCSPARRSRTTGTSSSTARGCGRCPETPPPLLCAAVSEATARWGGEWADGLATVNAPVETLRAAARRVRARGPARAPGPRLVGADPGGGGADRVRPVAHERLRPAGVLGPRHAGGVRRRGEGRPAGGPARQGADLVRPGAARRRGCRSSRRSASTTSRSTTSARTSTRSSTRSASTSCRSS